MWKTLSENTILLILALVIAFLVIFFTVGAFIEWRLRTFCADVYPEAWGLLLALLVVDMLIARHEYMKRKPMLDLASKRVADFARYLDNMFGTIASFLIKEPEVGSKSQYCSLRDAMEFAERKARSLLSTFGDYLSDNVKASVDEIAVRAGRIIQSSNIIERNLNRFNNKQGKWNDFVQIRNGLVQMQHRVIVEDLDIIRKHLRIIAEENGIALQSLKCDWGLKDESALKADANSD